LGDPGSSPSSDKIFVSLQRPNRLWNPPNVPSNEYQWLFPQGVNRLGLEADNSPPSSAECQEWSSYTSTPPPHTSSGVVLNYLTTKRILFLLCLETQLADFVYLKYIFPVQWSRRLGYVTPSAARAMATWVRIPFGVWMLVPRFIRVCAVLCRWRTLGGWISHPKSLTIRLNDSTSRSRDSVCSLLAYRLGKYSSRGTHDASLHCNTSSLRQNGHSRIVGVL
jgi:hypothetical protein